MTCHAGVQRDGSHSHPCAGGCGARLRCWSPRNIDSGPGDATCVDEAEGVWAGARCEACREAYEAAAAVDAAVDLELERQRGLGQ